MIEYKFKVSMYSGPIQIVLVSLLRLPSFTTTTTTVPRSLRSKEEFVLHFVQRQKWTHTYTHRERERAADKNKLIVATQY